jgi:hypothetical protein
LLIPLGQSTRPEVLGSYKPISAMDEPLIEDEKKPFEAEGLAEEEALPDPDEQLMLHQGNGRVWLVKVNQLSLGICYLCRYLA